MVWRLRSGVCREHSALGRRWPASQQRKRPIVASPLLVSENVRAVHSIARRRLWQEGSAMRARGFSVRSGRTAADWLPGSFVEAVPSRRSGDETPKKPRAQLD